ncbi:Flagellar basal body rod FlgEFG protein C-terminal [Duganella sp. CF517]|uniref:flagellar basal body rod C-terminal domain-containing protein n=1 Tax=Duganella sp. CF517 TaxID=1881038 RepID=UPI0008C4EE5F|nr:flagellar basal body rod C-terminal domain-containing protein [Duganella sp. CF517]SEN16416.1 Flagellar basal body rod FlgEFG protein C-terminal [Duganella sp. CF517]
MAISTIHTAATGLQASAGALANSAHSVANMSTAGFQPARASFQESSPAGGGVTLSVQARQMQSSETSGTDFATEATNSLVYKAQFDLSAKVIQAADQNLGTLIDIKA